MLSTKIKNKIVKEIAAKRENYDSDKKHAIALGINNAQYSRIKKGEIVKVISESKWITLARLLKIALNDEIEWKTVKTETFTYVNTILESCQKRSLSRIICDIAGIGKTHTAQVYASKNKNAVFIDCSQVKSKQKLVRQIAKELGVENKGRYADVYQDLVYYIRVTPKILIILDEAGDLAYDAFLELKALWNAAPNLCGWIMMGADGLKEKITRRTELKKVGYTEIFDRYGNGYKKVTKEGKEELQSFLFKQVSMVAKANNSKLTALQMFAKTGGSLRLVKDQIEKQQMI